jgi:broad specificity phosphatase PhoE
MMHLLLVRHGETDWNIQRRYQGKKDVPLNDAGRRQAALIAPRLARYTIDAAYASDLRRAWETAAIISGALGIEVKPEPRLHEIGFGVIEGLTFDQAQARYPGVIPAWLSGEDVAPVGGESRHDFAARVEAFLDELKQAHRDETVLLVTHGGPIRQILRLALHLPPEGQWYFQIDNASVSELSLYDERPVIVRLNDTYHLNGVRS